MKKFVVESNLPEGGILSAEELKAISVTITEIEEVMKECAQLGKFPIHIIREIKTIINPQSIIL
jgi:hypothetical protein